MLRVSNEIKAPEKKYLSSAWDTCEAAGADMTPASVQKAARFGYNMIRFASADAASAFVRKIDDETSQFEQDSIGLKTVLPSNYLNKWASPEFVGSCAKDYSTLFTSGNVPADCRLLRDSLQSPLVWKNYPSDFQIGSTGDNGFCFTVYAGYTQLFGSPKPSAPQPPTPRLRRSIKSEIGFENRKAL
jgi:hypothetical protein